MAGRIKPMKPIIEQIKEKLPISDALNRYTTVKVTSKGNALWCSCLQKQERTPSMQIFPDKNYYRCFSCGTYGDQIDLVSEALRLTPKDAIKYLAKDLGIEGGLSQEEAEQIAKRKASKEAERQKEREQNEAIDREYKRLIDIEKLLFAFLTTVREEKDLDSFEIGCAFRDKDLIAEWIDILLFGELEDKLAVVEISKRWKPWKERKHEGFTGRLKRN